MFAKCRNVLFVVLAAVTLPVSAAWKAEIYDQGSAYPLCDSKESLSEFSGALNKGDTDMQAHMVNSGSCTLLTQKLTVEVVSQSMFGGWSKVVLMDKKAEGMPPVYTVVEAVHRVQADEPKPATPQKNEGTAPAVKSGAGDEYTAAEKALIG